MLAILGLYSHNFFYFFPLSMALMLGRRAVSCCCPGKHTNLSSCHIPPAGLPVTVLPAVTMITFVTENKPKLKIVRDFKG